MKRHRTQLILEDEHYTYLKETANRRGVSISSLVREMVEMYQVEQRHRPGAVREDPMMAIAGDFEGSGEAVGRNAEEILYGRPKPHVS